MKTRQRFVSMFLIAALAAPAAPAAANTLPASARGDVRAALLARGVDVKDVDARVRALTDAEAVFLAERIDQLPAGGRAEGFAMLVLVAFAISYLWPVIVFAGGVAIIGAIASRAPSQEAPAVAAANEGEEAAWSRD